MDKTVDDREQGRNTQADAAETRAFAQLLADRPTVRVHLLGPMRATTCLGDDILPRGTETRALFAYLCLAAGQPAASERLAALLWDQVPGAVARNRLQQALHELAAAFGAFAPELISAERDTVRLKVEACWIDALAVGALDAAAFNSSHGDLLALCAGELLDELDGVSAAFDRWLLDERTRFTERLQSQLEIAVEQVDRKSAASKGLKRARADMRERAHVLRQYARRAEALAKGGDAGPTVGLERMRATRRDEDRHSGTARPDRIRRRPRSGRTRLRVGVLPFLSDGTERVQDLAFSLSQEIAGALARFRWFDVIAPVSLRRTPSTRFIGDHELHRMGLDYVVDGTVSSSNKGLQISVRLLDLADYARPVWAECFNLALNQLHRLNELTTVRIVGRIDPVILWIEGQPDKRREHYGATGLLLQAIPLMISMERRKYEDAGRLIARAVELEPDNAKIVAWAAHWHHFYIGQGWGQHSKEGWATTQEYALRAIRLDPHNAEALGIYAHYCSVAHRDFDTALHYFDRALRLNPSLAANWAFSALTYCYIGEPDVALQRLERYHDLAPLDPYFFFFENFYTVVYTFKGDYERAVVVGRRAISALPNFINAYKPLIAALGHLGRREEAKPYVDKLLSLEPNFTVERHGQVYPFKKAGDRRRYLKGLRLAGVPER
jgi:DNA-binding SARP family transcriptional activator/TolB-like protein/Tfp pilus assembly protein PilF